MSTMDEVFAAFEERPEQLVSALTLRTRTGFSARQIYDAVSNLRGKGVELRAVARGGPWIYSPGPTTAEANTKAVLDAIGDQLKDQVVFTKVGVARDGSQILEDPDGKLWKATAL